MIQKKVCILGAFAVGKTSLVQQYVHTIFSNKYLTTVGVKIDKKVVNYNGTDVSLMLWDMVGKDDYTELAVVQLRGASAYVLVLDPTRPGTLDVGTWIQKQIVAEHPDIPFIVAMNKHDLVDRWSMSGAQQEQIEELTRAGWRFVHTSAKTGEGVEAMFEAVVQCMQPTPPTDEEA